MLATWICSPLCGVLAGAAGARATFAARQAQVHAVSAVLTDDAPRDPLGGTGYDDGPVWVPVRWKATNGDVRTDLAKVIPGAPVGTRITAWTDPSGRRVSAPVTGTATTLQAGLIGALVAPAAGAAVWAAGWVVRTRLIRRRTAEWGQEWKQAGPQWGNLRA